MLSHYCGQSSIHFGDLLYHYYYYYYYIRGNRRHTLLHLLLLPFSLSLLRTSRKEASLYR